MITPYLLNKPTEISNLQKDALEIFGEAVTAANPYSSTCAALKQLALGKLRFVLSIGKAAVPMLQAVYDTLGEKQIQEAVLVTKYGHLGDFHKDSCVCFESGHPVSDENSEKAVDYVLRQTDRLKKEDVCLVLISGGGSALFEKSLIAAEEQHRITDILLKNGADIYALNCIRKRLSAVKGGRLAQHFEPAGVITLALSDVPGSRPDVIASGPTQPDPVPDAVFRQTVDQYNLNADGLLDSLPPKAVLSNPTPFYIVGDVKMLCEAAAAAAEKRGYTAAYISTALAGDVNDCVRMALQTAMEYRKSKGGHCAFLFGGEPTVCVKGSGKGGRSQQAALLAAMQLENTPDIVFLAGGSDGTDGPTDAAGGLVDGRTAEKIKTNGLSPMECAENNDAYPALKSGEALLMTGPTGTNVNDLYLILF